MKLGIRPVLTVECEQTKVKMLNLSERERTERKLGKSDLLIQNLNGPYLSQLIQSAFMPIERLDFSSSSCCCPLSTALSPRPPCPPSESADLVPLGPTWRLSSSSFMKLKLEQALQAHKEGAAQVQHDFAEGDKIVAQGAGASRCTGDGGGGKSGMMSGVCPH